MIIIGHRGASGLAPENTLPSFDAALRHKVAIVELDVRLTKDGHLIVIHDAHTKRIAGVKKKIRKMTLQEIKQLATRRGILIPTLSDVIVHLHHRVKINIELKSRGSGEAVLPIIQQLIDDGYRYKDFFISSFHARELFAVRRGDTKVRLALLHRRFPFGFLLYRSLNLYGAGFHYLLSWPITVRLAKNRHLFTYTFTVNNRRSALLLKKWGFDAICTDYPDTFSQKDWHIIEANSGQQQLAENT